MIPSYMATAGSGTPTRNSLQPLTALQATGLPPDSDHKPPHVRMIDLLSGGALTVSEIAAYLKLPTSVCTVVASQLLDRGHLRTHVALPEPLAPDPHATGPTKQLLEEVLHGLRGLRS